MSAERRRRDGMVGRERLQKVLAARGVSSRREAERMIREGRVRVNEQTAVLGQQVDPENDRIEVDGVPLPSHPRPLYLALNKPAGYVTSLRSTHGEPLVMDLVDLPDRLLPLGRLVRDTTGLLLLTNDGEILNHVTHPRYEVEREYRAVVSGRPGQEDLDMLRSGVVLPDGSKTGPAEVEIAGYRGAGTVLRLVVWEGKKRQIRLMCSAVGHPVLDLCRVRIGPVRLGTLAPGRWRHLTLTEVSQLASDGHDAAPGSGASLSAARR